MSARPVIAYLFTTFPKPTETFIQREVAGLLARGLDLRLYSLHGGGPSFNGLPVDVFSKWELVTLLWHLPLTALRRPRVFGFLLRGLLARRPPCWLNFWENLLGAGFAAIRAAEFRALRPARVHAVWATGPATAAWLLNQLDGHAYSAAAHAYDIYRHGGDWWLLEKLLPARFVHTSTDMAAATLRERGVPAERIHVIRRGLNELPILKPLRADRSALRLLCVARLVPKKGFAHQLRLYAALRDADVDFEARIAGDGPLRAEIEREIIGLNLADRVHLLGHRPQAEVAELRAWADVLLHTGVVAADGDRDGLPNVIPEAMAAGVLVVTSPEAATTEAVTDRVSGRVVPVADTTGWVDALIELRDDTAAAERYRAAARAWTEANYDANKNAARLAALHLSG
ncbi:MAG: glycosyltransferase [Verrucomicrobiota bacterium]